MKLEPLYWQSLRGQRIPIRLVEAYNENGINYWIVRVKRTVYPYKAGETLTITAHWIGTKSGKTPFQTYLERDRPRINPGVII